MAQQIEAACRAHGFFYVTGHGVAPELLGRAGRGLRRVLRAAAGGQDGDRHGARRPGLARVLPGRGRTHLGSARPEGGLYFDPGFTAEIPPLPGRAVRAEGGQPRWDGQNLHAFTGTYSDYLLSKVSKVFPQLRREVLAEEAP